MWLQQVEKVATKMSFEKMILCRGFTNSPSDIHKFSLKLSHLFETTSLDSCLRKIKTDVNRSKHGCMLLKKWDLDSKDSKWVFEIDFQRELLRKVFYFK